MGGRGSSSSTGGAKAIASATKVADRAVNAFLAREGGMASDGEIDGTYEKAFIKEATRLGASNLQINNALNNALRTNDVDYMGAAARENKLTNRTKLVDYVKKQTNVDLSKVVEPRVNRPRTGLGVHLEDLTRSQQNAVRSALRSYGKNITIEDNGGFGSFIRYEK